MKIISKGQFTRNVVTLWPFAFLLLTINGKQTAEIENMQMSE